MSSTIQQSNNNIKLHFHKAYASISSLKSIMQSLKSLKMEGKFGHSDNKLIEEGLIHISQIRQSNAEVLSSIDQAKIRVGQSKENLEKKNLQLQNLTYQNMNISLEIKKHQNIRLENLERLGYNINTTSSTQQLKDILYKELNERKTLEAQLSDLKRKFSDNSFLIKEKQSILSKIPANFAKLSKTLFPSEIAQNLNDSTEQSEHQLNQKGLKKFLPKPLFILHSYLEEFRISQQINQEKTLQIKVDIEGEYGDALQFIQNDVYTKFEISNSFQNSALAQSLIAQNSFDEASGSQILNSTTKESSIEVIDSKEEGEADDADCLIPIAKMNNCNLTKDIVQRIKNLLRSGSGIAAHPLSVSFSINNSENKVFIFFYYIPALGCLTLRVESALDINEHTIFENLEMLGSSCTSEIERIIEKITILNSKGKKVKSHYFEVVNSVFNFSNMTMHLFKSCLVSLDLNNLMHSISETSLISKSGWSEHPQPKVNTLIQSIIQRIKNVSYVASQISSIQQNKCISKDVLSKLPSLNISRNFSKSIDLSIISQIDFFSEIRNKDSQDYRIENVIMGSIIAYKKINYYRYSSSAAIYFKLQIKKIGYSLSAVFEVGNNYPQSFSVWTLVKIINTSKVSQDQGDTRFIEQLMHYEQLRIEGLINSEFSNQENSTSILFSQIAMLHDLFDKAYEKLKDISTATCSYILDI